MIEDAAYGLRFANELSVALSSLPAMDRASFIGLSVPGMRARIIAKADEYHKYTLALHSMQNALAPVHRLPVEILSMIFIEAWQDRKSLRLTHVCRLWRSLLLDTSQFWAVAIGGDEFRVPSEDKEPSDEDYLAVACVRSAPRNLSLRLSSISSRGHLKLVELADRITSLQLSTPGGDHLEWLWQALYSGMPGLEDLVICLCDSAEKVAGPHPLPSEMLPRLTRLTLPAILFPFSWRLSTIQEIALRSDRTDPYSHRSTRISLNFVLESLEYYPKLKALEIDDEAVIDGGDIGHAVEFPALERLRIAAYPGTVSAVLSRLTFPPSANVDLEIVSDPPKWPDDDRDDWLSSSHPYPQPDPFDSDNTTLNAIVALIDQVTVENGAWPTVHGYIDGAERFRVRYVGGEYDRSRESERSLTSLFARTNAPVSHVLVSSPPRISQYASINDCPFSPQILAAFPRLTHLNVGSPNATSFLFALSPEQPSIYSSSYSTPRPSMPAFLSLEELTLDFEMSLGHERITPLRLHDTAAVDRVADGFRQMCQVFIMSLANRLRDGHRLSRLEFFWYEQGCMAESNASPVSHIDLAALNPELVEDGLKTLNVLVDGPVVFSGYRFFTHTPEPPARMY